MKENAAGFDVMSVVLNQMSIKVNVCLSLGKILFRIIKSQPQITENLIRLD